MTWIINMCKIRCGVVFIIKRSFVLFFSLGRFFFFAMVQWNDSEDCNSSSFIRIARRAQPRTLLFHLTPSKIASNIQMLVKYKTEWDNCKRQKNPQYNSVLFFFFNVYLAALIFRCGMRDLVPSPVIEPRPPALGVWSFNQWTTREAPSTPVFFNIYRYNSLPGYIIQVLWHL